MLIKVFNQSFGLNGKPGDPPEQTYLMGVKGWEVKKDEKEIRNKAMTAASGRTYYLSYRR